ncbi:MAG: tetratricopeptide repeat protein [Ferruginibacter sp.]
MKKICSIVLCFLVCTLAYSQAANELHETAKSFMRQGDHANAIIVLNRALQKAPNDVQMTKDLALSYYFQRDNSNALKTINGLLDKEVSDDQTYQIAGLIYKQGNMVKDAEKMYKKALKKFPNSGPLYNELGELQWQQQNFEAIKQWEKGIETDPSYSKNYYNASKYYYLSTDKVWGLLYGEIFLNMEPLSNKAPEIKELLLDSYKKLFSTASLYVNEKENSAFVKAYLKNMNTQTNLVSSGINAETLSMLRTRFILDWFNSPDSPSFRLFAHHQQLLREGLFEAYNQWLFGSTQNLIAYQQWINTHASEYNEFLQFQKGRIFKIASGEYYK